jgi:hypothetical protein
MAKWKFNLEDDVHYGDYRGFGKPTKKKVLAWKRKNRPNYIWKAEDLKMSKGFRLFYKKK